MVAITASSACGSEAAGETFWRIFWARLFAENPDRRTPASRNRAGLLNRGRSVRHTVTNPIASPAIDNQSLASLEDRLRHARRAFAHTAAHGFKTEGKRHEARHELVPYSESCKLDRLIVEY